MLLNRHLLSDLTNFSLHISMYACTVTVTVHILICTVLVFPLYGICIVH